MGEGRMFLMQFFVDKTSFFDEVWDEWNWRKNSRLSLPAKWVALL